MLNPEKEPVLPPATAGDAAALAHSLSRLQATLEATTDAIVVTDEKGTITWFNENALKLWGVSREMFVTENRAELRKIAASLVKDPVPFLERIEEIYAVWPPETFDIIEFKDGRVVERYSKWQLVNGQKVGRVWSFHDITNRAEEITRRKQAVAHLNLALAAGELGDWSWSIHTDEIVFGARGLQIFGLKPGTTITWKKLREYLHFDDRERARLAVERALATHSAYRIEYRVRRPSGEHCWVAANGQGVYAPDGSVTGMIGIVQDITERKNVEEALREEYAITEQLNSVAQALVTELDVSKIVQIITDAGTKITRAQFGAFFYNVLDEKGGSYMLYALSGVPRAAFEKFPMPRATALFGPTFRGEGVIRLDDVRKDPRFGHNAPHHGMPAGHLPVISYLAVPVISRSGTVLGGLFFGHSEAGVFTERDEKIIVGIAAQTAAAMDTATAYQAEQQARAAAEQANQAKDHFLAALSHELRTPLTPVLALLSDLCTNSSSLPKKVARDLETMRRNVELESRLIDDLLDLTRISQGKLELHLTPVPLGEVIEDAIKTCLADLKARDLNLVRDITEPERMVLIDGARITQILWNLLKNSIKFTPPGGTITIRARIHESGDLPQLTIEVEDTGKGIEACHLQRLFKAFEQGDRQITRQFGGLGLGLAISRAIAESHLGTLTASSLGLGLGSIFTLSLPLQNPLKVHLDVSPAQRQSSTIAGPPTKGNHPWRVLLVEDHTDTAVSLHTLLTRRGYSVEIAKDIATALQLVNAKEFDILVSDLGLPDGTGYELMQQLAARYPALRGIALSGYGMDEDIRRCMAAGFTEHLVKPVKISQLEEALARVTGKIG